MPHPIGPPIRSLNKQLAATLEEIQLLKKHLEINKESSAELKAQVKHCLQRLQESTRSLKILNQYRDDFAVSVNPKVSKHLEALTAFLLQKNKFVQEKMGQDVIKGALIKALNEFTELISRLDIGAEEENLIRVTKVDQDPLA